MQTALEHLNWLAVVVAVIAYGALGYVWFSFVVGRAYAVALGRGPKTDALSSVVPLLCLTVTTIMSATLLRALGVMSFPGAIEFGAFVGIGYLVPMTVNIANNPLFPRPMLYSLINAPFFLIGSLLISTILVAMR